MQAHTTLDQNIFSTALIRYRQSHRKHPRAAPLLHDAIDAAAELLEL